MKSWHPAYTFQGQQAHLVAQNARQLGNVIKKNYPALASSNQTTLNLCQDGTSTDEILSCIWSEITNTINDPSYAEKTTDTRTLMNVSHNRSL